MSYFGQPLYPAAPTTQLSLSNISGSTTLGAGPATYTKAFSITGAGSYTIALPALDPTNYPTASFSITNNAAALCTINVANSTADTMQLLGSSYTSISILPGERMVFQNLLTLWVVGLESASRTTTAPQFDNSIRTASTAFVQTSKGSFAGHVSYTTSQTLTAAHIGKVITFYGVSAATFTLPGVSTIGPNGLGSGLWIANQSSSALTVSTNGGDLIQLNGSSTTSSMTLNNGDSLYLCASNSGTAWIPIGGTSQLPSAALMSGANWTTAAQFDNTTKLATTAFVQRALGNYQNGVSITGTTALTASQAGQSYSLNNTAAYTVTLPSLASVQPGATFKFYTTNSAGVTIAANGSDSMIYGAGTSVAGGSVVTYGGDTATFVMMGAAWQLVDGTMALKYSVPFGSSLTAAGYQKLPSGLIIQWGALTTSASGYISWTFPIAFTTAVYQVLGTTQESNATNASVGVNGGAATLTSVPVATINTSNAYQATSTYFFAIGK